MCGQDEHTYNSTYGSRRAGGQEELVFNTWCYGLVYNLLALLDPNAHLL
jgi:hypothetical protein